MHQYSARAEEVARDLFAELDSELRSMRPTPPAVRFHLDSSEVMLSRSEAVEWVKQSVDDGFPQVRYYLERRDPSEVTVNLAAFEDPDFQYHP
jgi:hypothetical protein